MLDYLLTRLQVNCLSKFGICVVIIMCQDMICGRQFSIVRRGHGATVRYGRLSLLQTPATMPEPRARSLKKIFSPYYFSLDFNLLWFAIHLLTIYRFLITFFHLSEVSQPLIFLEIDPFLSVGDNRRSLCK